MPGLLIQGKKKVSRVGTFFFLGFVRVLLGKTPLDENRGFHRSTFLVRQACAALGAATGQYLAAVRRAHTLAEAMLLGALALLGLIRSLHFLVHLPV